MKLHRKADIRQLSVVKEEVPSEHQERNCSLDQDQEHPEPPHIKEEHEELWISQGGEQQLQGLEEADITKFTFTPVPVKSEDDGEKPQSSQLHQTHTEHMETEAAGEDCGGPGPDRNSGPESFFLPVSGDKSSDSSEPETDVSDDDCRERPNFIRHMRCHSGEKPFGCSFCDTSFAVQSALVNHMRIHTGEKPFDCSLCDKRFTQKAGLNYHLRTHTGERPFSCSVCGKTFRLKGAMTYHMATHTGVKPFSCSVCNKRFRGMSQLRGHKCVNNFSHLHGSQNNKSKGPLHCSECDTTFPNNYMLVTHMRIHKGKKLFTCSVCGQKRHFRSHLDIHMRTHTGEKPYSCSVCGKTFSQRGIMSQHMAIHSGVKPFSCSDCGRRFSWHFQIKNHKCLGKSLQRVRTSCTDVDYGNCVGPRPAKNSDPDTHLQLDTMIKPKPSSDTEDSVDTEFWKKTRKHQSGFTYQRNKKLSVDVNICKQLQSDPSHLKTEDISVSETGSNTDKKPLSSSECLRGPEGSQLNHSSPTTGEKPFSCSACGRRFTFEPQLISHECAGENSQTANRMSSSSRKHQLQVPTRLQARLKPFSCSVCGKGFFKRESLRSHMTSHSGEKPFHCSVCNAGFSDTEALVQHMRIHTSQTQFSCQICGEEFAWRRYLTKHMEVHSKETIYSCSAGDKTFRQPSELNHHQFVGELQLHESQTEENREAEPAEAAGEDCGGPEPDRSSHLDPDTDDRTRDSSETETDDNEGRDLWTEGICQLSGLNSLKHEEVSQSDVTFNNDHLLKTQRINHTGEKHFTGESLSQHVVVHTGLTSIKQEFPESPHIKEEQEELWSSQEGEQQLQGLEEADITKFTFTPVPVKSEDDGEKPQSSQLHQTHTEHMETEAAGEDCGGPGPHRDLEADCDDSVDSDFWKETRERPSGFKLLEINKISGRFSGCDSAHKAPEGPEPESDDSVDSDFWKDDRKPQSDLKSLNHHEVTESELSYDSYKKPYSCSKCRKRFQNLSNMKNHMKWHTGENAFVCSVCGLQCPYRSQLVIHMRTHTREKPFPCPVCGKKYAHKASMQSHMLVHTVEKQYRCRICDKGFGWYTELKYHQCAGESPQESTR